MSFKRFQVDLYIIKNKTELRVKWPTEIIQAHSGGAKQWLRSNIVIMHQAVDKILSRTRPKIRMLLKSRRFYGTSDMIFMFKTHLRGLIETNTPAIYHAAVTTLRPMDNLQNSYVHELGMSLEAAFLEHNVAPLCLRRDIAMLGLLFKIAHGICHPQLRDLLPPAATTNRVDRYRVAAGRLNRFGCHRLQLLDRCEGRQGFYFGRSLFGLVRVWN